MRKLAVLLVALSAFPTRPIEAQSNVPAPVLAKAQSLIQQCTLRGVRRVGGDSLVVSFDDPTLTSAAIGSEGTPSWQLCAPGAAMGTPQHVAPKQAGLGVAKVIWNEWAKDAGIKRVVLEINGTRAGDPAKVRFYYLPNQL